MYSDQLLQNIHPRAEVLVARERAPGWAREDMYNGNGSLALKVRERVVQV